MKEKIEQLFSGIEQSVPENLRELIANSKKPLRVKFGADPSAPDLHLGHTVVLNKLKVFQELGHHVIFLIGDYTAMIGDPTGKSETRKALSAEDVKKNALTYQSQVFKVLDKDKTEVRYNAEWLDKLSSRDIIRLSGQYTVARMLERDDFSKRFKSEKSISIHEFLYPLLQGYDSVALKADIEIGGTDQTFNLLMGRHLQKEYGEKPQSIMTVPILEGTDGIQKMSKSLNNHIGIMDSPKEMFGKLMSIPDNLIIRYYTLLTDLSLADIGEVSDRLNSGTNPKQIKEMLAEKLVSIYHSESDSLRERESFNKVFSQNQVPEDMPVYKISKGTCIKIIDILMENKMVASKKEAVRLFQQKAVTIESEFVEGHRDVISYEGQKQEDQTRIFEIKEGEEKNMKVGKRRWLKIVGNE
jgi:tyrosyl-tRNA synthetase